MQAIELKPGMRVRCVDAGYTGLIDDARYEVESTFLSTMDGKLRVRIKQHPMAYWPFRFKPIIRVKARTCPRGSNPPAFVEPTIVVGIQAERDRIISDLQRTILDGPFAGMTESDAIDLVRGGY